MPFVPEPPAEPESPRSSPPRTAEAIDAEARPVEVGGPPGLEPTRYGDWERRGRCIDF